MSRKHTKRKVWALVNPIAHAIEGARITSAADLDAIRMRELSAMEAFSRGQATEQEFLDLCGLQNICVTMSAVGGHTDAMVACDAARDALNDAKRRFGATGVWGVTGPGLAAMRELFAWHDAQRLAVSRSVYADMIAKTARSISAIRFPA